MASKAHATQINWTQSAWSLRSCCEGNIFVTHHAARAMLVARVNIYLPHTEYERWGNSPKETACQSHIQFQIERTWLFQLLKNVTESSRVGSGRAGRAYWFLHCIGCGVSSHLPLLGWEVRRPLSNSRTATRRNMNDVAFESSRWDAPKALPKLSKWGHVSGQRSNSWTFRLTRCGLLTPSFFPEYLLNRCRHRLETWHTSSAINSAAFDAKGKLDSGIF